MNINKPVCPKCSSFREITLHLHELSKFCDLINDTRDVYKLLKKKVEICSEAKSASVAKWLMLASQLETVEMNTFRYEEAHVYCDPVADELNSNSAHYSSFATHITRFIFISNALEEAYRLTSGLYEERYVLALKSGPKIKRQRSYSTQAAWLIDEVFSAIEFPDFYFHKVDALLEISSHYKTIFNVGFDVDLEKNREKSRGLSVVRNIRNHIAHAVFPIVENPEFTWEFDDPRIKNMVITLLLRACRVATMNIQILLSIVHNEFKSQDYFYLSEDLDVGEEFQNVCTLQYLKNLHLEQSFGLNESSQWAWRSDVLEG
ncbi:hypothetical protein AKG98_3537 [Moritella sp. JT01]|uniref:hypothetical protein n=1 Tax=Moritella sp. JT01 TaxID=756698 RepID=UPI00079B6AA9|nr:hypothetical protein [Moritella sp. JT01]KXO13312.1 hypothetical protein AKG98_3537 [Moritella sp. JT01]